MDSMHRPIRSIRIRSTPNPSRVSSAGRTWRPASGTRIGQQPDRDKMAIMGQKITSKTLSRHDGQESFGQIVTVTESPLKAGLIYAGTDDGMLQVSKDDGHTWKNVAANVPGLPKGTYVTRVH